MPDLKILYFDVKGLAEAPRLALEVGGVPFDDERFAPKDFPKVKESGRLPFGQVPLLSVDGTDYAQSDAILRYAGKQAGLYPRDDDVLALAIDEVLGVVADIISKITSYSGPDKAKLKELREQFVADDIPRFVGGLEKIIKAKSSSETWVCGDSVSVADLALYFVVGNIAHGKVEHVPTDALDAYPRVMASYNAVLSHPKVSAWNEKHPW